MENQKIKITVEELSATLKGAQKLHALYTQSPEMFLSLGRKNGKTLFIYNFTKQYISIITAYEKAERKAKKKLGYLPLNAVEFTLYIIIYAIKSKLRRLSLRFRLWRKPKRDCYHCCVVCKYFDSCRSELEAENETKTN